MLLQALVSRGLGFCVPNYLGSISLTQLTECQTPRNFIQCFSLGHLLLGSTNLQGPQTDMKPTPVADTEAGVLESV